MHSAPPLFGAAAAAHQQVVRPQEVRAKLPSAEPHLRPARAPQPAPQAKRRRIKDYDLSVFADTRTTLTEATIIDYAAYTDPDYTAFERHVVFEKNWFCVAHVAELTEPGTVKVVDVGPHSYLLVRDRKGQLHAHYNSCRHRGAKLCTKSATDARQIVCPYHQWAYKLDGQLKATPPVLPFAEFSKADHGLLPVAMETFAGLVFLNPAASMQQPQEERRAAFLRSLGDLPQKLQRYDLDGMHVHNKSDFEFKADWKLAVENFIDFYHIDGIHPGLKPFSKVDNHHPFQGEGEYVGFVTAPITNCGGPGDLDKFQLGRDLLPKEKSSALFFHIFPNVSITLYPHSMYTLIMLPTTHAQTKEQLTFLMHKDAKLPEDSDEQFMTKCDAVDAFFRQVNDEDVVAIDGLQKGLENVADETRGVYCHKYDWPIHRFQNQLLDRLHAFKGEQQQESEVDRQWHTDVGTQFSVY